MMLVDVPLMTVCTVVVIAMLPEVTVVVRSGLEIGTLMSMMLVDVPLRAVATVEVNPVSPEVTVVV